MESLRGETSMSEFSVQDTKKMRKTAATKINRKTCQGPKELFLPQILVACTSNKIVFTWDMWYTLWKMHFWMYLIRCVQWVRSVANIPKMPSFLRGKRQPVLTVHSATWISLKQNRFIYANFLKRGRFGILH